MAAEINIANLEALGRPLGQYSHLTRVRASEYIFIAGMVASDKDGKVVGERDFWRQAEGVFENIGIALRGVGADFSNVVQFTTYLVHSQWIPVFMEFRKERFPSLFKDGKYPPNTLLIIDRLVHEPFLLEVQTVAAL